MDLGKAFHDAVLLPEVYAKEYAVSQKFDRRTKEGKAAAEAFAQANEGKTIIDEPTAVKVFAMATSIKTHPGAAALLEAAGEYELSLFWTDAETGIDCRLRCDKWIPDFNTAFDLKTTQDASGDAFPRSIHTYGYALQAAFYLDGMNACGLPAKYFAFGCVESDAPHGRAVYQLDDESVELGRKQYRKLLNRYAECLKSNCWPSYSDQIEIINLPAWAMKGVA